MITEYELKQAIAECQAQQNPNANTCIKLASYLTILESMTKEEKEIKGYSFSGGFTSGSEFSQIARGKDSNAVMKLLDDLITTLQVVNPRLYDNFIDKLLEL